jgi:uncharacterized membrane protein
VSAAVRVQDQRGLIGFSLIRWTIILVLIGVVIIEGGSIIFTSIGLQSAADAAAVDAASTWQETRDLEAAKGAALRTLDEKEQDEARIVSIEAENTPPFKVRLTVRKQASTLIVHRIGFLADFARVDVEAEAQDAESGI